jgi:hypothetical protein
MDIARPLFQLAALKRHVVYVLAFYTIGVTLCVHCHMSYRFENQEGHSRSNSIGGDARIGTEPLGVESYEAFVVAC